jgi:hypothetical protein
MSLSRRLRPLALAFCVALAAGLAGMPADAVEAPPGSTNFTPPADVPNYFSNESGPFQGGANARNTQPGAGPSVAVSAPRRGGRHPVARAAKARGRYRLAHGRASAHRQFAHVGAARGGKASGSKTAHAQVRPGTGKALAAKSRAASSKSKHTARAHG